MKVEIAAAGPLELQVSLLAIPVFEVAVPAGQERFEGGGP